MVLQNVKTFKDVKGCDDAKKELEEVVEYLKNPSKFTRLGGKLPKVIILWHPASNIYISVAFIGWLNCYESDL